MSQDIAMRDTVESVCEEKQAIVNEMAQAVLKLKECEKRLKKFDNYISIREIEQIYGYGDKPLSEIETAVQIRVDAICWRYLISRTNLGQFMTRKQREEFDQSLSDLRYAGEWKNVKFVPLTVETAMATMLKTASKAGEQVEQSVVELFEDLSYYHKTNDGFRFGSKLIFQNVLGSYGIICHRTAAKLYEFQRVIDIMENRMPAERAYQDKMYIALKEAFSQGLTEAETDSLKMRVFKNGNAHVWIKSKETTDKMNAIVAKRLGGHVLGK